MTIDNVLILIQPKVQCLCPCFADTAIIDDKDGGNTFRRSLEKSIGILTVTTTNNQITMGFSSQGNKQPKALLFLYVITIIMIIKQG